MVELAINHTVRFRVSKSQLERIQFDAKTRGYRTPSDYLRDLAMRGDHVVERKVIEISKDVKELLRRCHDGRD